MKTGRKKESRPPGRAFPYPQPQSRASQENVGKLQKEPKQTRSTKYCVTPNSEPDMPQGVGGCFQSSSLPEFPSASPCTACPPPRWASHRGPGPWITKPPPFPASLERRQVCGVCEQRESRWQQAGEVGPERCWAQERPATATGEGADGS